MQATLGDTWGNTIIKSYSQNSNEGWAMVHTTPNTWDIAPPIVWEKIHHRSDVLVSHTGCALVTHYLQAGKGCMLATFLPHCFPLFSGIFQFFSEAIITSLFFPRISVCRDDGGGLQKECNAIMLITSS